MSDKEIFIVVIGFLVNIGGVVWLFCLDWKIAIAVSIMLIGDNMIRNQICK